MSKKVKIQTTHRGKVYQCNAYESNIYYHIVEYPWPLEDGSGHPLTSAQAEMFDIPRHLVGVKTWHRSKGYGNTTVIPTPTNFGEFYE